MRAIMSHALVMLLALVMGMPSARAQSADETAVNQAVESLRKAALAKDRAQFDALLSEQLSYGHSAGRVETKKQFIDDATGPRSVWKSINLTEQTTQVAGSNAIVRHVLTGETESAGKTTAIKIGVLMVWRKEDGNWRLLARQAFRI